MQERARGLMIKKIKVTFDVDGTLIYQSGEKEYLPKQKIIDLFKALEAVGCEMYIWSGHGVDYAKEWSKKLGLQAKVVEKGSFTPDLAIDDLDEDFRKIEKSLGIVNIQVDGE